ncbi:MAG: hypothetical protein A2X08_17035 [Bacteroidetes bacterium GWA2_32_17]|nr:MAG: hypothetical protein A2X08_17035 [Bacteroidetes bacterium GWA2_32_17]
MSNELTWFALYTRPRFELKAEASLKEMGIITYLPMQKTLKEWCDRKKWITEPLFKSYCFIQINPSNYCIPLKAYGVVHYVWFDGKPAPVRDKEIEVIKLICNSKQQVEVVDYNFKKGQNVKVTYGPLKGLEGEFIENKGKYDILVRFDSICQGVLVSISPKHVVTC